MLLDTKYCPECDLSFLNLASRNLNNANLWGAQLQGSNLSFSTFINTNFSQANLTGANLRQSDLRQAQLTKTQLNGADLSLATWVNNLGCEEGSIGDCYYEFRIDPTLSSSLVPDISQDGSGNYFVVWNQNSGLGGQIWGRRYDAMGNALGDSYRLDTSTFGKTYASIATN